MGTKTRETGGIMLQKVSERTLAAIDPRLASNAAAVVFDDFIIAVDVGMRPYASRLFREALEEKYRRPVRFVCLTHYHADHAFGLRSFRDATIFGSHRVAVNLSESPDWTPDSLAGWKANDPEGGEWLDEVELVLPRLLFHGRLDISDRGGTVEFHHSGGHTDCSVWGYHPGERVLLAGDLLFAGGFPFAGDSTADPERWMSILRAWLEMDIDSVIPGHGPVAGLEEVGRQLEFFEILKRNTLAALEKGLEYRDIILPSVYPPSQETWFAERTVQRWHAYYGSGS